MEGNETYWSLIQFILCNEITFIMNFSSFEMNTILKAWTRYNEMNMLGNYVLILVTCNLPLGLYMKHKYILLSFMTSDL